MGFSLFDQTILDLGNTVIDLLLAIDPPAPPDAPHQTYANLSQIICSYHSQVPQAAK